MLTGEQFKSYVSDLRVKSNVYKQRRAELNDLKAEYGILSRTLEILRAQEGALSDSLDRITLETATNCKRIIIPLQINTISKTNKMTSWLLNDRYSTSLLIIIHAEKEN